MAKASQPTQGVATKRPGPNVGAANRGNAGKGRVKGQPNALTVEIKDQILAALKNAGGEKYLAQLAKTNPQAFAGLLGKLIPRDLNVAGNLSVVYEVLTGVGRGPAQD